jgi:hypothetical protein
MYALQNWAIIWMENKGGRGLLLKKAQDSDAKKRR